MIRQTIQPGLIDVSLTAYGHSGPWSAGRGFDSLVQFSSGIAAAGRDWRQAGAPVSLPVQALDHATGYLMAAAALRGLIARRSREPNLRYRLSLARTVEFLFAYPTDPATQPLAAVSDTDLPAQTEATDWGPARRVRLPVSIEGVPAHFSTPAGRLGSAAPVWTRGAG